MLRKIFAFLVLVCMLPVAGKSQALIALLVGDKIKSDKIGLGLLLCEQSSFISDAETAAFHHNPGLGIGAYVDVRIGGNDKWILQNYLLFKAPKGAAGLDVAGESFPVNPLLTENMDRLKRNLTYIQLTPVMRYCFTPSWSLGIGPYIGFLTSGFDTYSATMDNGALSHQMKVSSNLNPVDVGAAIDLQYRILKGKGVQLNLRFEQGMVNVYRKDTGKSGFNRAFHFGVGIPMAGDKKQDGN